MVSRNGGLSVPLNGLQVIVKKRNLTFFSLSIGFDGKQGGIDSVEKIGFWGVGVHNRVDFAPLGGTLSRQRNELRHTLASVIGPCLHPDLEISSTQKRVKKAGLHS